MTFIPEIKNVSLSLFRNDRPYLFPPKEVELALKYGFKSFSDLESDFRPRSFKYLRSFALEHPHALLWWNSYYTDPEVLPKERTDMSSACLLERLIRSFEEYVKEADEIVSPMDCDMFFRTSVHTAASLRKVFLEGVDTVQAGIELNVSSEQVRILISGFMEELHAQMEGRPGTGKLVVFRLSEEMKVFLRDLKKTIHAGCSMDELKDFLGTRKDSVAMFALNYLGLGKYGPVASLIDGCYVVDKGIGKDLNPLFRTVISMLDERVEPQRESKLIKEYQKEFGRDLLEMAFSIMRHSDQFVVSELDGVLHYQLAWKEHRSVQTKVERILYDFRPEWLEKEKVENEYLARLRESGILDVPKLIMFKTSDKIGCTNNLWKWICDDTIIVKDVRPYIQKYVIEHDGKVTLAEVIAYVRDQFHTNVKDNSIRAYLTNFCTYDRKEDLFILKDLDAPSGRGDVTMNIVRVLRKSSPLSVAQISKLAKMTDARVRRTLKNHEDIFMVAERRPLVKGGLLYKINPSWKGGYTPSQPASKKEPSYVSLMREFLIHTLRNAPEGKMPLKTLVKDCLSLIPDVVEAKHQRAYAIIKKDENFIVSPVDNRRKEVSLNPALHAALKVSQAFSVSRDWTAIKSGIASLLGAEVKDLPDRLESMLRIMFKGSMVTRKSYFHLLLGELFGFLNHQADLERKDLEYLRNLMSLTYEQFLRNLYELTNGYAPCVQPGLGQIVKLMQEEGLIPQRRTGAWFTEALSHIISVRGRVAHPDERDSVERVRENILEFIRLYVSTASFLKA